MRLALNGWFYDQPHTGSGQYLRGLLDHLPALAPDIEPIVVIPNLQSSNSPITNYQLHSLNLQPFDFAQGKSPVSNLQKIYFEQVLFPRACKHLRADLAHIPYWAPPLSSPVPFVVTIHDLIPILLPEFRGGFRVRLYNALVSAATSGAAHIITDSDSSSRDVIQRLNVPADKVTTVHLAIGHEYKPIINSLADVAVRQKYNLPETYVLYLGGFQPHKNVRNLLAAWTWCDGALGEGYPLVIAGKLPEPGDRFYEDLPGYAKQLNLDYVRFVGPIAEEDKPAVYRGAACFVFPSRYEGFGLPLLEALACGVPVVTTAAASIPEVVGEAAYLVPDPDDTRALGAAIIAVVVNSDVVDRLTSAAREQVKKFSWQKTVEETVAVYRKVLGG
jgi:glycosyltransferase involved in cell wall biosynthesis